MNEINEMEGKNDTSVAASVYQFAGKCIWPSAVALKKSMCFFVFFWFSFFFFLLCMTSKQILHTASATDTKKKWHLLDLASARFVRRPGHAGKEPGAWQTMENNC